MIDDGMMGGLGGREVAIAVGGVVLLGMKVEGEQEGVAASSSGLPASIDLLLSSPTGCSLLSLHSGATTPNITTQNPY